MKKLIYKLQSWFLTKFGNIKIFPYPFFLIYDPNYFKMSGEKIIDVMGIIKPGDVLIRGYDAFLDGYFIKSSRSYSHAGIYIGDNEIIHAVSPNVSKENIVEFCECDRIAVLRPRCGQRNAIAKAKRFLKDNVPYDFGFSHGESALYCFELVSEAYPKLKIEEIEIKAFFGLIKKKVILSDSFFNSKDFELIFEYNPKYKIDFCK